MSEQDNTRRDQPAWPRLPDVVGALQPEVTDSEVERAVRIARRRPAPEALAAARRVTAHGR